MARWFFFFLLFLSFPALSSDSPLKSGDVFKDCESCPELVVIPAGKFLMGDAFYNYPVRFEDENGKSYLKEMATTQPIHEVNILKPFAMGRYEITLEEWFVCVSDKVCRDNGSQPIQLRDDWLAGKGSGRYPKQSISYDDALEYLEWISQKTGHIYRLPSEAEWEYAARGNTETRMPYWWGMKPDPKKFVTSFGLREFTFFGLLKRDFARLETVGSKSPNPFGLYDMLGNLRELTGDCVNDTYDGAPKDGSAWMTGKCDEVITKGSFYMAKNEQYFPVSTRIAEGKRWGSSIIGLRVLRELD